MATRKKLQVELIGTLDEFNKRVKEAKIARVKLAVRAEVIPRVEGNSVVAQPYAVYRVTAHDAKAGRVLKFEEKEAVSRGIIHPDGRFEKTASPLVSRADVIQNELEEAGILVTEGDFEVEGVLVK